MLSPFQAAGIASFLALSGIVCVWSTVMALRDLWLGDALKSIGMVVPLVSFLLILRVWRSLGWELEGTWWGLVLLVVTAATVLVRQSTILIFVFSPQWSVVIPPHAMVAFAYGSAMVLLFGGTKLYRASLFPLFLLWLVNPVPHVFNVLVDLPLQHASAHVARAFAIALGQPLTPDQLSLMFTPEFGMFIAPGCNGIRGAVTMGLISLVAGYLYRFRLLPHVLMVAAAVLLGYLFNFVRLCTLVIYYIIALHFPRLQNHGEMADYYIGGALFLIGTMLLLLAMRRAGRVTSLTLPPAAGAPFTTTPRSFYLRAAAVAVLIVFMGIPLARAMMAPVPASITDATPASFPARVGNYQLTRTWADTLSGGVILYQWGEYTPDAGGVRIQIAVSPILGPHDTLICHTARGEDPLWHGQLTLPSAGSPIAFSGSFFNDGATQYLEATTLCNGTACGEFSSALPHFGFVYSKPDPGAFLNRSPQRPIPILLRAETLDTTTAPDVARQKLTESLRSFIAYTDLAVFTQPYRQ
ncbi:exosortase J [Granulicella pectinivorans]|uniref:exosortase J n=1 Tax=Granulicella pectinivorans TaxID=474950 RepID=UPI002481A0D4|nr:exosortase J [Granulicella pectinivorans]